VLSAPAQGLDNQPAPSGVLSIGAAEADIAPSQPVALDGQFGLRVSRKDHDVGTLFFWNDAGKFIAMAVNVSCPSQEVEGLSNLNADFWHPVRESLRKRYGQDVCVLGWTGAAGDQSPHLMYRKGAEERMRALRKLTRVEELARRIVAAVDETYETVELIDSLWAEPSRGKK